MQYSHQLDLSFRGSRDYLQGADLYQGMLEVEAANFPPSPIQIQYHSLLHHQPDLVWSTENLTALRKAPAYRGEARFGTGDQQINAVLLESDRPISRRVECNEKEVVASAQVDVPAKTAVLPFPSVGTPMEMVVFLNKQLHFQVLPHVTEKWLFVKLDLKEALPQTGEKQLTLILRQILGDRFTRAEILIDDKSFGFITFSTAK